MRKQYNKWLSLSLCIFLLHFGSLEKEKHRKRIAQPKDTPLVRIGSCPCAYNNRDDQAVSTHRGLSGTADWNINAQTHAPEGLCTVFEKMKNNEIDKAAIMGSLICYRAIKEIGAIPKLVRPVERNGISTYVKAWSL